MDVPVQGILRLGDWQAIYLNANYAMAHNWYSQYLAFAGRSAAAIKEAKRAQEIDPLSPWNNLGFVSYLAREYDQAIRAAQKTLELDLDFAVAYMIIGLSYLAKGMFLEGISALQKAKDNPDSRALLGYAYAVSGNKTTPTSYSWSWINLIRSTSHPSPLL